MPLSFLRTSLQSGFANRRNFSVGDLPKAHELIAIAFWVFFLIKAVRGAWLIGLVLL